MSFSVSQVRSFLLRSPKPAKVRVSREDGEPQELTNIRSYARAAETIAALNPEMIEAFDKDGGLLRAVNASGPEPAPSTDIELPKAIEAEPLAAAFMVYGRMLARAYEHSTDVAFSKMVELVERMNDRSDGIEQRLERSEAAYRKVQEARIDDAFDRVDEAAEKVSEADPLQHPIVQSFLGGMMQPKPPAPKQPDLRPPARARTNGHAKGDA